VYAHRQDAPGHKDYLDWLRGVLAGDEAYGISDLVLSGFVQVVTHPRVFSPPSPLDAALAFAGQVRGQPNCVPVTSGSRHWDIFTSLCRSAGVKGTSCPTRTWRRWRSSRAASGSRPTGISAGSRGCAGGIP